MEENVQQGLTNHEALRNLKNELSKEIEQHEEKEKQQSFGSQFESLNISKIESTFHWSGCFIVATIAVLLLVTFGISTQGADNGFGWYKVEFVVCVFTIVINIWFSVWNTRLRKREFICLSKLVLKQIEECLSKTSWSITDFPPVHSPISPCISLQWTIRDGKNTNVPIPLLVKGDIILLRPGQRVPAKCVILRENSVGDKILMEGDIYVQEKETEKRRLSADAPQSKTPVSVTHFKLLETAYVSQLRKILSNKVKHPVSSTENERYNIACVWLERRLLPFVAILLVVVNVLRTMYIPGHVGHWAETVIILPINAILPLTPLFLPIIWRMVNYYGQARVYAAFTVAKDKKVLCEDSFSSDSDISEDEAKVDIQLGQILNLYWDIANGQGSVITRQVNIAQTLGSVSSFCCVDKKGILSWPNPSAEKICFLTPESQREAANEEEDQGFSNSCDKINHPQEGTEKHTTHGASSSVEVLDLTHAAMNAFELQFDDPGWMKYMSSLKPLGLNILANTCNEKTMDWYTKFTDHVASEALANEDTVAVVNRRCLCELARQIGFTEKALDGFLLDRILGLYRQVSSEESAKAKVHRAKSFVHHQIPMPNMFSVVMKEKMSGSSQIFSQGTGDILMDCCSDYWNGEDVCPLTENDRKKMLDFYHRSSMAAYCTAFSYRPLTQYISPQLCENFIQLPQYWSSMLERTSVSVSSDADIQFDSQLWKDSRAFSMDSLFDNTSTSSVEDTIGCCQAQSNQVFIGMVTMQYQARQDFVQLIDKLEIACIRFVHFSQENEVRSRVFSEKMGLEAGWNCHISLRSDLGMGTAPTSASVSQVELSNRYSSRHSSDTAAKETNACARLFQSQESIRSRSYSAPSIVNLDSSQVRFQMSDNGNNKQRQRFLSEHQCEPIVPTDTQNQGSPEIFESETTPLNYEGEGEEIILKSYEWTNQTSDNMGSGSRNASSYLTDDSLTGALDNRARLPRGIENIRPHLENVDNVPLLVNLFTDCTAETTREMMEIMQEHGEVVVCTGSNLNIENVDLFLQGDCSLAVEPLYPVVCAKNASMMNQSGDNSLTPMAIAASLISLPCPLIYKYRDNVGVIQLITEARTFLLSLKNTFYLMLCYHLSVTLIQVFASLLLLPPVLAPQHLLWLLIFIIPLLSLSMMGNAVDFRIMNNATVKYPKTITKEMILQFLCYYCLRFLPAIIVCLFCYTFTLHSFCESVPPNFPYSCAIFSFSPQNGTITWYEKYSGGLIVAQNILLFLLVLFFATISVSFVHWSDQLWQQCPTSNKMWSVAVLTVLLLQCVFFACDIVIRSNGVPFTLSLGDVHPAVYGTGLPFPLIIIVINELVKRREVKLYSRYQKRRRLSFGTKLGMNSPF
ncbi:transmembrane protein 94-like [Saccostrea echinata]|uniref:transmembrane protein 94-like n=1 Tax=Saccostrea echinata TaxID=191078 RepID=UPI002A805BEB|nr:transmembrane protein 94-like [Saccostrea echinata]